MMTVTWTQQQHPGSTPKNWVMLVVLLLNSSICNFSFTLFMCFFCFLEWKHIFHWYGNANTALFKSINSSDLTHFSLLPKKSAVIGHLSSVSWVSPGLCLWLFPPPHTSILSPLCHLPMAHAMAFVKSFSQLHLS